MSELVDAAQEYARIAALTAGRMKSWQLLVEHAIVLMPKVRAGEVPARNRVQDIVAQVQAGLDLSEPGVLDLFRALGVVWDALEYGMDNHDVLDKAEDRLRQLLDIIVEVGCRRD